MSVTREDKIRELKVEMALRKRVYPNLVKRKKLTQEQALRRMQVLQSIINDYERGPDLFMPDI
jgi:hypothetical protein